MLWHPTLVLFFAPPYPSQAIDDYSNVFDDGVLPEACVLDVLRARATVSYTHLTLPTICSV
eukprot:5010151-Prymnesium_polylepis.2